ncbi:calponin homology and LIM domain-containing protein isoform X3 [Phlebotomus argentipes]|uniref:calponin homology and LIM domain-containing protein isoform X3 n=1 Tax=Phlebotomus argentipes TaxID=94469 RepID=UPI0028936F3A|nr:calponin homology and LIM domain-containing protein isoform X3 [Phlebotomus argentipes]
MGNLLSVLIGCVGAVELITLLHQITTRAELEYERLRLSESGSEYIVQEHADSLESISTAPVPQIHFEEYERSSSVPESSAPVVDGLKTRPLVRDDGTGRRRAFKKRDSSGSLDSKLSREEELKMFTSLEEEEFRSMTQGDYVPISYNSESGLKVKKHHKRHRKSPTISDALRESTGTLSSSELTEETLSEGTEDEVSYPWGDINPEHHKGLRQQMQKTHSIGDLNEEDEKLASSAESGADWRKNAERATKIAETDASADVTLIFSGEYTKAMSKDWHTTHFCCWQCDESLTGQRYVLRDDHPYCIKCYENVFANTCESCNKIIGIDSKDLSYKDKHWHEACFLCNKCRISLVDKQFGSKADRIYCGNCYDQQFASRCDGCGEIFRAGTKKMEYKTRQWHEKCFCCCVCKTPIGTKSFIPREQEIYCAGCYEEKYATRCIKCNKIITSGGVTYKNEPWHRECFTCTHCSTSLAGQRFTSRDDKPYCADCFGELFAKRCTACTKPITGIGGTRFISFEDRHWHNDCFICALCKTSLVGRGFITDGADIICPECAKQKLI